MTSEPVQGAGPPRKLPSHPEHMAIRTCRKIPACFEVQKNKSPKEKPYRNRIPLQKKAKEIKYPH